MDVALTGDFLEIVLDGPGESFVAFEHAARTVRELKAVQVASRRLLDTGALLKVDPMGGCEAQFAAVTPAFSPIPHADQELDSHTPVYAHAHAGEETPRTVHLSDRDSLAAHDGEARASAATSRATRSHTQDAHADEGENGAQHSDWTLRYSFRCRKPDSLRFIDVRLFDSFPAVREIRAQVVTATTQFGSVIDPDNRQLELRPTP